jgi:hypothetical protein
MEKSRDVELTSIARELIYLQANLRKKQKKLAAVMKDKDAEIAERDQEIESLRSELRESANLATNARLPLPPSPIKSSGLETPASSSSSSTSGDEISPCSFSRVPRFVIRPKKSPSAAARKLDLHDANILLPPPLPPPRSLSRFRRRLPPVRGHGPDEAFMCTPGDSEETASLLTNDEGFSSCQEAEVPKPFECFLTENGLDQKCVAITPSVSTTNHRTMLKPSDVKSRSKSSSHRLKPNVSNSDLTVLEEHEVSVAAEEGKVKTVTHWTGPFV